ncbi:laccase-2-like [Gossypium australe]|uniref:Laccase-2-like n=1 Tax=Gossypium australe TaxID=47621 RepID=A0A5B6WRA8_9ROSI|nr:laccase-2-like [Gossypium australe]
MTMAAQKGWKIHHLDVKSAFQNGIVKEEGFVADGEEYMYERVDKHPTRLRFERSVSEPTLYIKKEGNETLLIVSLYVDDLLVTSSGGRLLNEFK